MSKYTLLESELSQINEARFQIACNAFLAKEYEGDLQSPGTVIAKEKTRKGKPDSFIFGETGKLLLAEYTTKNKSTSPSEFYDKLEQDLKGCLDFESLGVKADDVSLIILCCNSVVEPSEVIKLKELTDEFEIPLRIVGLQTLALHFSQRDRVFAKEFFNIPYDTGQLLSKSEFLSQYGIRNFSTPLDNALMGREKEVDELIDIIDKNRITIVKGVPGAGKTRLMLHTIDRYLEGKKSYKAYYFFGKGGSILEDLLSYIEHGKNYIFFIDDANRQIENFVDAINTQLENDERIIKIVATVRDYAKEEVIRKCRNLNPIVYPIDNLSYDIISRILTGNDFSITDKRLVERILQLSKGNPRLAIMAAKIVKNNPDITLLNDGVSNIYDEYFQSIIDDKQIFNDSQIVKALGLLSFFQTIDLEIDDEKEIFEYFGFSYGDLIEIIERLEEMEIVEIYSKYTVKMSEQVMATFFFYKAFFKKRLLSFPDLMTNYFSKYSWRIRDSFNPANSTFGSENVFENVKQELINYYRKIEVDKDECLKFLNVFGQYLPMLTFQFITSTLGQMPDIPDEQLYVKKEVGYVHNYDFENILQLLEPFSNSLDEYEQTVAIELTKTYLIKIPALYSTIVKKISENFKLTESDLKAKFWRQKVLYTVLKNSVDEKMPFSALFYDVFADILLNRYYDPIFYEIQDKKRRLKEDFQIFRNEFWQELISGYVRYEEIVVDVFMGYVTKVEYAGVELLTDVTWVLNLFDKNFNSNRFGDCYIVHNYLSAIQKRGVENEQFDTLLKTYSSDCFRIYKVLTWADLDLHALHRQMKEWEEVEVFKEEALMSQFQVASLKEFEDVNLYLNEIVGFKYSFKYNISSGLDIFFGGHIDKDPILGLDILSHYLNSGNIAKLWPVRIMRSIFKLNREWQNTFYRIITQIQFPERNKWLDRYFQYLPEDLVDAEEVKRLKYFFKTRRDGVELQNQMFDKFLKLAPEIYEEILQWEVDKSKLDHQYLYKIDDYFFKKNSVLLERNLLLCKEAYFQQQGNSRYDNDSEDLFALYEKDAGIINEYIDFICQKNVFFHSNSSKLLTRIWEYPNPEKTVWDGLLRLKGKDEYYIGDHLACIFFTNIDIKFQDRAYSLLCKMISEFSDDTLLVNMAFDIARNCLNDYYYEIIQHFLIINQDIDSFKKLKFYNNHFSSNGDAIWADFKASQLRNIYNAIKNLPKKLKYLLHLEFIENEILLEERDASRERKMRFRGYR